MATHPEFAHDIDDTAGLAGWVDDDGNFFADPAFLADIEADRRLRAKLRKIESVHSRVMVGAGLLLLAYMAFGIIVAAFDGRL